MCGTVLLLPFYSFMAVFMVWTFYIVPNPMSLIGVVVACFVPATLWIGLVGAKRNSESQLQMYAFLMIMAVTMQASAVIVVLVDDGTLSGAYMTSCTSAAQAACGMSLTEMVGGSLLPEVLCECAEVDVDGSGRGGDMGTCVETYVTKELGAGGDGLTYGLGVTMVIELFLAYLAYGMMVDLDIKDAKKAAKLKGGAPVGTMRGEIICGLDLLSIQGTKGLNRKEQKMAKKAAKASIKSSQSGDGERRVVSEISNRYVVLSLNTPGLHNQNKHHITQKTQTESVEDDSSPEFAHTFSGWVAYAESQVLEVQVFDKVGSAPVCVGSATVEVNPQTETLPEYEYAMDGSDEQVEIPLTWTNKGAPANTEMPAGAIHINLVHVPAPKVNLHAAAIITKTWYFEATVLAMVALSMFTLAQQAPALPPSILGQGALKILEIFVATHMSIELTMEIWVLTAAKDTAKWWRRIFMDPWLLLALAVLACNWMSIMAPNVEIGEQLEEGGEHGAMENGADQTGARSNAAATLAATAGVSSGMSANMKRFRKIISVGRVFRIVRPIRTLRMIQNVDIIVTVLEESMSLFATVCLLLLFLLSVFALIGLSTFSGALQYECIGPAGDPDNYPNKPVCSAQQHTSIIRMGHDECPMLCPVSLACAENHKWCAPLETGRRTIGNDRFGYRDYDNIWRGIVTMFVQTTGDGGMHTLPLALNDAGAASSTGAWVISFFGSVLLNLIALNLFLAVCCSAYSEVAAQSEELEMQRTSFLKKKRETLLRRETSEDRREREEKEAQKALQTQISFDHQIESLDWSGSPLRNFVKNVVLSAWFERFTSTIIVGNTVTMMLVHEGMDPKLKKTLGTLEAWFLACFIVEALMKWTAMGRSLYVSNKSNMFDIFVISASILGYMATYFEDDVRTALGVDLESMQSLRAVRLLRALQVVRLLHRQKALIVVLRTIFRAWKPLLIHTFFCMFSMAMFSIIGMHIFGGSLGKTATIEDYDVELSSNFESFTRGFLTTFEMTVGEEWSHTMYWYTKFGSLGHGYPEWTIQVYFILQYVWMNSVLFSLYIAMLLDNFSIPEEDKMPTQKRVYDRQKRAAARKMRKMHASVLVQTINESTQKGHTHSDDGSMVDRLRHAAHGADLSSSDNKSLYLFTLNHPMRIRAAKLQSNPYFSKAILILIMFSCLSLALEGPGEGSPGLVQEYLGEFFRYVNVLVLVAFAFEGTLKCIVHGFVLKSGPTKPYLGTKMNRLDFTIIVLCSVSYLPFIPLSGAWARALRLGRVITPMLNLSKNPEIKLVFISFVRAGPDTAVVLLPLVLMGVVFSILGVATFGSVLKGCVDPGDPLKILTGSDSIPVANETVSGFHANQTLCESVNYDWVSPPFNFDSSLVGLATLLVTMTDGAHGIMLATTAEIPRAVIYWVLFHLAFTCFFLNLFIGVLSASFEKSSGVAVRAIGEKQWASAARSLRAFRPSATDDEELRPILASKCCKSFNQPIWWFIVRTVCFKMATNDTLETFWKVGILANTITLASDKYPIETIHVEIVTLLNMIFLLVCTAEVVVKLVGFGPKHYFSDGWLVSDFILVSISISLRVSGVQSGVEVLRVMRVFRMIVLASKVPSLVKLIDTLIKCLRASMALVLITSLIVYLYSIIGMNMFGLLPSDDVLRKHGLLEREEELRFGYNIISETCPHCGNYTDYTNFTSFFHAFRLLMQLVFGQGLRGFVTDLQYIGAEFWKIFIFFASFYCLAVWVCMNLLIVTVLSNFDAATTEAQTGETEILPIDMDGFAHCWSALTVGAHICKPVAKREEALLEYLQDYTEAEDERHGTDPDTRVVPDTVNFEDGAPKLCGTLTIRVIEIGNMGEESVETVRPYLKMTTFGTSMTSKLKLFSPTIKPDKDGTAKFSDKLATDTPEAQPTTGSDVMNEMNVHITGAHTHIDFEVRNAFQFCDHSVGAATIDMDDIREKKRFTRTLDLRMNKERKLPIVQGDRDRWERFVHFDHYEEEHPDEEIPDDGADTADDGFLSPAASDGDQTPRAKDRSSMTKQEKRAEKLKNLEDKKAAKARKKSEKEAKKLEKKLAKQAAKEEKRLKKLAKKKKKDKKKKDPEPEEEYVNPHRFFQPGWEENGMTLKIEVEYEPALALVQKKTFMSDYAVRYAHKEKNAGVEGWMEVSENGGKFKRRYCYLQQSPYPAFKMCRGATDINMLEGLALRRALVLHEIKGEQILSVFNGHDKVAASTKRKNVSLQIVALEPCGSGNMEEAQIGMMSGIVLGAADLKRAEKPQGVPLVEELSFEMPKEHEELQGYYNIAGEFVPEEKEEEFIGESTPEEGEVEVSPPEVYMVAKRTTVRAGASLDSNGRGSLKRGEVIDVVATKLMDDGILRLRFSGGWTSAKSAKGKTFMIAQVNTNQHYRIRRACPIYNQLEMAGATEVGEPLEKGDCVEGLELTQDPDNGLNRIRIQSGWISEIDTNIKSTPDTYCVLEVMPLLNDEGEAKNEKALQELRTQTIENDLTPDWNHGFDFNIYPSSTKLRVQVFDANSRKPALMGTAEIVIGEQDIPGPLLSGACMNGGLAELRKEIVDVKIKLTGPDGADAGSVLLEVTYVPMIPQADLVAAKAKAGGDLCEAMMVEEMKESTIRFRAMSNEIRRAWLCAMRWVATNCEGPAPGRLPAMTLFKTEVEKLQNDISELDLPFCRVSLLLKGLYKRRIMGPHKPTARRLLYTIFNLETFAWSKGSQQLGKKKVFPFAGVSLREIRGLHFHLVLERLCLLHYGKRRCLGYEQQMDEYQTEIHHVSLHIVSTCVAMWVARRRTGKTFGGYLWPSHNAWQSRPSIYKVAVEGMCVTRLRTLGLLMQEIQKCSKPELMDVELPPREKLRDVEHQHGPDGMVIEDKGGGMCGKKQDVDDDLVEGLNSPESQPPPSEDETREALTLLFKKIDVDGGGTLDHGELKEALALMLGGELEDRDVERMIRMIDEDMNGELDLEEFVEGMLRVADESHNPDAVHHKDDTDSDLDELDASVQEMTKAFLDSGD